MTHNSRAITGSPISRKPGSVILLYSWKAELRYTKSNINVDHSLQAQHDLAPAYLDNFVIHALPCFHNSPFSFLLRTLSSDLTWLILLVIQVLVLLSPSKWYSIQGHVRRRRYGLAESSNRFLT